jgi:hypothetical protein
LSVIGAASGMAKSPCLRDAGSVNVPILFLTSQVLPAVFSMTVAPSG